MSADYGELDARHAEYMTWEDERPQSALDAERERAERSEGSGDIQQPSGSAAGRVARPTATAPLERMEGSTEPPSVLSGGHRDTDAAPPSFSALNEATAYATRRLVDRLRAEQPNEPAWLFNDDALETRVPKLEARLERLESELANMQGVLAMAVQVALNAAETVKGRAV